MAHDVSGQFGATRSNSIVAGQSEESSRQVKFREPVSNSEMVDTDPEVPHNEGGSPANWNSGNSPYAATHEDPSSGYAHYLAPVPEEPSSSLSEGTGHPTLNFNSLGEAVLDS